MEAFRRDIKKYEKILGKKSLSIKQQKEILRELKARPLRQSVEVMCDNIDFVNFESKKYIKDYLLVTLEFDDGSTVTFKPNDYTFTRLVK